MQSLTEGLRDLKKGKIIPSSLSHILQEESQPTHPNATTSEAYNSKDEDVEKRIKRLNTFGVMSSGKRGLNEYVDSQDNKTPGLANGVQRDSLVSGLNIDNSAHNSFNKKSISVKSTKSLRESKTSFRIRGKEEYEMLKEKSSKAYYNNYTNDIRKQVQDLKRSHQVLVQRPVTSQNTYGNQKRQMLLSGAAIQK